MVPLDDSASLVSSQHLKTQSVFRDGSIEQPSSSMINYIWMLLRFFIYPSRAYFNPSLIEGIVKCVCRLMW